MQLTIHTLYLHVFEREGVIFDPVIFDKRISLIMFELPMDLKCTDFSENGKFKLLHVLDK